MILLAIAAAGLFAANDVEAAPESQSRDWSGSAEASVLATTGNTNTETIGAGGEVQFNPGIWKYGVRGNILRSTTSGALAAKTTTAELRAAREFNERLDGFGQFSYLENRFAGFNARFGVDVGAGYKLLAVEKHVLRIELGMGYMTERRTDHTVLAFPTARPALGYHWAISELSDLSNTTSLTQNLEEGVDRRLSNVTTVSSAITRVVSFKVSYTILHLSRPVPGFGKTDTTTSVAVVTKF